MRSPKEQASDHVKMVENAFLEARGAWTGVGVSLGALVGITPKTQVLNAIDQIYDLGFVPWKTRRDKIADVDVDKWQQWVKDGNDMLTNLRGIAQDANIGSLPQMIFDTATATASDVKAAAKSVWNFRYFAIVGVVVIGGAFALWKLK